MTKSSGEIQENVLFVTLVKNGDSSKYGILSITMLKGELVKPRDSFFLIKIEFNPRITSGHRFQVDTTHSH